MFQDSKPSRRDFLVFSGAFGAQLLALSSLPGPRLYADTKVVADEAWASVERLAEGFWAVLSKPLAKKPDWRTTCNGGLVAGRERVLVIDGFARVDGARWVGEMAHELTGKWPTDVVISHFHGDHTAGVGGFVNGEHRPRLWITEATRELIRKTDAEREGKPDAAKAILLESATILDPVKATTLDLGGRAVQLHPRSGHTPSDVTIEVDEPSIVYCGDLVWNQMFPNFTHAIPSRLSESIRATVREPATVYVPGHGPLADKAAMDRFRTLIDDVEAAARQAFEKGVSAAQAAKAYQPPKPLREWHRFRDSYYELAIGAWHRELEAAKG